MALKGVVFDFNGTLFFDSHLHNQAWDAFLDTYGLKLSDEEKNHKIHGKNNARILETVFARELTATEITNLSIEKENLYQALCLQNEMALAPGAEDFLGWLASRQVPFTIATASDQYNVDFYFDRLKLGRLFDYDKVIFNDGTLRSKPDPEIFLKAMAALGIRSDETLIFEDSPSGIKAAENAGAGRIIVVNSTDADYSAWDYTVIRSFAEVDRALFE